MEIVVTGPVEEAGLALLTDAGHDVRTVEAEGPADLASAATEADALIVAGDVAVTAEVFERASNLQIVGRAGIDVGTIDVSAATEHGVIVANAPEETVRSVAEYVIGLLFATARGIPQGHVKLKDGYWAKGDILGSELEGKTAGLVGFDDVGQEVGKRLDNLGVDLVVHAPAAADDRITRIGAESVDLETCLDRADFLSLHASSEDVPRLGESEFEMLGEGYVVNCGDPELLEEAALADAVADGVLRGAALDAVATEPLAEDSPLRGVEDVIVTPGVAASTVGTAESVSTTIAREVLAAFDDGPVENAVNVPAIPPDEYPTIRPYADLAETAGRIAVQLFDGDIDGVEVTYAGEIATENVEPITASALAGVLDSLGLDANAVNARLVTDREGIEVDVVTDHEAPDFRNLITLTVRSDGTELSVEGTQFANGDPRIVRIDEYRVEAVPHGYMLIVRNADAPGVIGYIGTVLGDHDVNIAGMFNSREAFGNEALSVYNLDSRPTEDVLEALHDDERILETTVVELNGF
ncbi:NAD(P)-dependent oxidoreductase [Halorhabdus amylolytica]|uniref:NAD(P)-dependent oxidoreductase n=1 Tax=Halorhabdus amylolytica TaxID=2559573 RepID=UPI0010AA0170|nr:NAD(P)-dependent oxidoreductase [Halorhabdus amylolytica]